MADRTRTQHEALQPQACADGGRLSRAGRLWVLETFGDASRRGLQHGRLLSDQVRAGAANELAQRAFNLAELEHAAPSARAALESVVRQTYEQIERGASAHQREELTGIAEGSGLDYGTLFRASFLSEAMQMLVALRESLSPMRTGACTSAVATGARVSGGGALHAKNQDYDGGGSWDLFPLVHIAHPDEGLAHVSAGTAGLIKGNLTLNAAGVTIGGHFLFSRRAGKSGPGFVTLERELALQATSVEHALEILRARPCLGAFAFVIADRAGQAVVAECDGDGVNVRTAENDWLSMSNLFSGRATDKDLLRAWGAHRNPLARQTRAEQCGASLPPLVGVEDLAAILADRFDPVSRRRRGAAQVIAHATTVTSAIADTVAMRFWVGEAERPTAHGRFWGFECRPSLADGADVQLCGAFECGAEEDRSRVTAFRAFLRAETAFKRGQEAAARDGLAQAIALDRGEAAYPRFLARLQIREGSFSAAEANLGRALALVQGQNERAECLLLLGYVADLNGDRQMALQRYREIIALSQLPPADPLNWINSRLVEAARNAQQHEFLANRAKALEVPFDLVSGIE